MKTGLAKAVKSGPVLQLALNLLITSANSFTFHVLAQNHERDWPYSGDRFLNLASDSGAAPFPFCHASAGGCHALLTSWPACAGGLSSSLRH